MERGDDGERGGAGGREARLRGAYLILNGNFVSIFGGGAPAAHVRGQWQ